MNWLEISLTLDGELAEAVADVLAKHAHQGVSIESTAIEVNPDDEGRPIGPLRVRAYVPADDAAALEAARAKIEHDLFYLGMIQPIPPPTYTRVADANWAELWKANYKPIRIGERLTILPAWLATQPPNAIELLMDPGMAFGTGAHPTTQLCLALLETYVQPGQTVFDLGCGSGILSVAAIKLGAASALAVDIDPEADRATRENAALNGVSDRIEFRLGSLETALNSKLQISNSKSQISNPQTQTPTQTSHPDHQLPITNHQFPLVVANILARVIIKLLGEGLARALAPDGVLILSGILAEQKAEVIAAIHSAGLSVVEQREDRGWVALAVRPRG
ncbi:MAG: 50S ribosomal protein L11 methyltransferase [Chloroflexi bacterium]|nr:50S ribosomal protein L11 methyltransferase [Chloroflexota bacterium]